MNESQLKTLKKLSQFASELKELSFPTSTVSIELAELVSTAIESYLNGESKSLDIAFGLNPKRGAPGFPEQRKETAREVLQMQLEGKSWANIKDELDGKNILTGGKKIVPDIRELRRISDDYEILTMAEEVTKRLNAHNSGEGNK